MKRNKSFLVACSVVAVLAGCGGGGGGTVAVTTTTTVATTTTTTATPYGASAQAFFSALNQFRAQQGLPPLVQNAALDNAAANHTNYVVLNGNTLTHIEDPSKPGFTGVQPTDRAAFAGYGSYGVSEVGGGTFGNGSDALNTLVNSVYHRQVLMQQRPADIGIASGGAAGIFFADIGQKVLNNSLSPTYFGTYPVNGQTGVTKAALIGEVPNPYGSVTTPGFPVSVASESSTTLTVSSFTITENGQVTPVDAVVITSATDSNISPNVAFLFTKTPLKANTTYNVIFNGSVNGQALSSKLWTFTTGI